MTSEVNFETMTEFQPTPELNQARQFETEHRTPADQQPAFHLTPAVGWMNDPNGFSSYNGQVHLFYQYHPYANQWGPMHWGHQVSEDLMVWKQKPAALAPDQPFDKEGCFSGTAVSSEQGHVLVYTGCAHGKQNQCLAIGDGKNYVKFDANPILSKSALPQGYSDVDFRDPKLWKTKETWYLAAGIRNPEKKGEVILFSSPNLKDWTYESVLLSFDGTNGQMLECPDVFMLEDQPMLICSPQNMHAQGYEFHNGHNSVYVPGHLNQSLETSQFFQNEARQLDYGLDFYAPQTTLLEDGRRVLMGWMSSWSAPILSSSQNWTSQMTLPRELSFRQGRLIQKPIREIENWYKETIHIENIHLDGSYQDRRMSGRYFDMTIQFSKPAHNFVLDLACDVAHKTTFTIDAAKGCMEMDRTYCGMEDDYVAVRKAVLPENGVHELRVIMDLYSIEIFVNEGEMVLSTVLPTPSQADLIVLHGQDEEMTIDFHTMDVEKLRHEKAKVD